MFLYNLEENSMLDIEKRIRDIENSARLTAEDYVITINSPPVRYRN